jgi:DNA-binding MarR family transcriptional regulator
VGSNDYYLYALFSNGTLRWKVQTWDIVKSSPAIDSDGNIYIGSDGLRAYTPNGILLWDYETNDLVTSSPAVDLHYTRYFGSNDDHLYALNLTNGELKWKYQTGGDVTSSPAIGSDGTIYVGSDDNFLYAIGGNITNQPPSTPTTPTGNSNGTTGVFYTFTSNTTDPDDHKVRFGWDKNGDSIVDKWSGLIPSGTEVNVSFKWTVAGNYSIKVKARDELGADSAWSESTVIKITGKSLNTPPLISVTPIGPASGKTGVDYNFSVTAIDPDGDRIYYGWDWNGDEIVDEISPLVNSGTTDNRSHRWSSPGTYNISIKVKDEYGAEEFSINVLTITISGEEIDSDGDGIPDKDDPDDDNDGMPDTWELLYGLDPYNFNDAELDTDSDGWSNLIEYQQGTNPTKPDTDDDGSIDPSDVYPTDPDKWTGLFNLMIPSITLSKYGPSDGEQVTIYAVTTNVGTIETNALLKFYDGNPKAGGLQIGQDKTFMLTGMTSRTLSQKWTASSGNHTIFAVVESRTTGERAIAQLPVTVGGYIDPLLVISTTDLNIYRFEPGQERTISIPVYCYQNTVENVRLVILDSQNLTINASIVPPITMNPDKGEYSIPISIIAPQLPEGVDKLEIEIKIQVVGDGGIYSNEEELDIVISESAVEFLDYTVIVGTAAIGSASLLGAGTAVAASRNENWKYLLFGLFAVPLYTKIKHNETLDNFVRGQVYGHVRSKPGTHLNEIRRTLKVGNGHLIYHLSVLEREDFIRSKKDGRMKRFYPTKMKIPEETGIKLSSTQQNILDYLETHPFSDQTRIVRGIGKSQQVVSYNLNTLIRTNLILEEKRRGKKVYLTNLDEDIQQAKPRRPSKPPIEVVEEKHTKIKKFDKDLIAIPTTIIMDCPKCGNDIEIPYSEKPKVLVNCSFCDAKGNIPNPHLKKEKKELPKKKSSKKPPKKKAPKKGKAKKGKKRSEPDIDWED